MKHFEGENILNFERYGISQTSMWFFMKKVRKAVESSKTGP